MRFEYPWLLLLLIPFAAAAVWHWRMCGPALRVPWLRPFRMASIGAAHWNPRKLLPFVCYVLAGVLLIFALARPREGVEEIHSKTEGIDIMLVIDLSNSMNAIDAPPNASDTMINQLLRRGDLKNRLDTSKDEISKFIQERPNDRIGLIAFADLPYVVCPPTLDHGFLLANLMRLEQGIIGGNTGIASPIANAVKRLKDSDAKSRVIVLFTDGYNTVTGQITPVDAGKLAQTFDITIYTVGIGSQNARFPQESFFGELVYSAYPGQFDEPLLRELATMTGGHYYHAADAEGLARAMAQINTLEKTSMEQPVVVNWRELYPALCAAALVLLLLGFTLSRTVCLRLP